MAKEHRKFESLRIHPETHDKAKFLAKKSGKSIANTVEEIIDAVFTVSCTFSQLNLDYDFCITDSKVTITCSGRNNLKSGDFEVQSKISEKDVDLLVKTDLELKNLSKRCLRNDRKK